MSERFSLNGKPKASPKPASSNLSPTALRQETTKRLDRLTALWREAEKWLIGLQQPRHVHYDYAVDYHGDPNDECGDHDCQCIGLAKFAGKWRLCLGEYNMRQYNVYNAPISWCPVTDCTMEERMIAARYVNELEREINRKGEETLPKLDEAIGHLETYLLVADI